MAELKSSDRFFPKDKLLKIDGETSFCEAYKQLHEYGQGAFFLVEGGEVRRFVRAYALAEIVVNQAVKRINSMPNLPEGEKDVALREEMKKISNTPIKSIVRDVIRWIPFVQIDQVPVDVSADEGVLQNWEDRVFEVHEAGEEIGWYLNHESVSDATTEKTIFLCTNPSGAHENTDNDHGTCYRCPYPIDSTKKG